VPGARSSGKKTNSIADGRFYAVGHRDACLLFDIAPDFDKVECGLGRKNVAHTHLDLAFQFRQVSIQLIFRDSFATVELIDPAPDRCVDCFPVLQKPTVLFFLGLQQTEQYFLDAARAGRLELFLDSGLKGRIVDFDVHGLTLQTGSGYDLSISADLEHLFLALPRFLLPDSALDFFGVEHCGGSAF